MAGCRRGDTSEQQKKIADRGTKLSEYTAGPVYLSIRAMSSDV